jgi:hypothetical protein
MKTEVTKEQYRIITTIFHDIVFHKEESGRYYIKTKLSRIQNRINQIINSQTKC